MCIYIDTYTLRCIYIYIHICIDIDIWFSRAMQLIEDKKTGAATCSACPAGTSSDEKSTGVGSCICLKGYTPHTLILYLHPPNHQPETPKLKHPALNPKLRPAVPLPREQNLLKGHLPRVIYHQAHLYTKRKQSSQILNQARWASRRGVHAVSGGEGASRRGVHAVCGGEVQGLRGGIGP